MLTSRDVANYFLSFTDKNSDEEITNLKLQKLLYYAQALYLGLYDKPLFDSSIEAWTYGPVVPVIYWKYKVYKTDPLPSVELSDYEYSDDIQDFLSRVYYTYSQCAAWKLKSLTHIQNTPWYLTYQDEEYSKEIPQELMKRFYKTIFSISEEVLESPSLKDKIEFCFKVENNALSNPDLPYDFIAYSLVSSDSCEKLQLLEDIK